MSTRKSPMFNRLAIKITLLSLISFAAAQETKLPNILFLLSDDQAWSDYGFTGHPHIETPAIDALAKNSLTFTRGYTPVPLCRPSLASITTGLYPHQHGITGNDPSLHNLPSSSNSLTKRSDRAPLNRAMIEQWKKSPNLLQSLKNAGYLTLQTGKWWEGSAITDGGFTHGMTQGDSKKGGRHGDLGLEIGRKSLKPIYDFIHEAGDQPWFVWYGVFLPHTPHDPPIALLEKYRKVAPSEAVARYWANCERLDQGIGELMAFLKKEGKYDDTIIIYTCDNGWIQNPQQNNAYAPRSKRTLYEGGIRTPIMVSWNGHISPQMDVTHLASNLDLWPTIAQLTRTEVPKDLPGIPLTDPAAVAKRNTIFGSSFEHDVKKIGDAKESLTGRCIIDGNWKLIIPHSTDSTPELYDLMQDPWEKNDLAKTQPERVSKLTAALNAWWTP